MTRKFQQCNFVILLLIGFTLGSCGFSEGSNTGEQASPQSEIKKTIPTSSNIYRFLDSVSPSRPFYLDQDTYVNFLTRECLEIYGFKLKMPEEKVISAHSVNLPIDSVLDSPNYQVEVVNTVYTQKIDNGVVYREPTETKSLETRTWDGDFVLRGQCIGTEYILENSAR